MDITTDFLVARALKQKRFLSLTKHASIGGSISSNSPRSWTVNFGEEGDNEIKVHLITEGGTVLDSEVFRVREGVESYQVDPLINEWFRGPGNTKDSINEPVRETNIVINSIDCFIWLV